MQVVQLNLTEKFCKVAAHSSRRSTAKASSGMGILESLLSGEQCQSLN